MPIDDLVLPLPLTSKASYSMVNIRNHASHENKLTEQDEPRPAFPIQPGSQYEMPIPRPFGSPERTFSTSFTQVDWPDAETGMEGSLSATKEQDSGQSVSTTMIGYDVVSVSGNKRNLHGVTLLNLLTIPVRVLFKLFNVAPVP